LRVHRGDFATRKKSVEYVEELGFLDTAFVLATKDDFGLGMGGLNE
jgi:hypothetical protein